MFQIGAKYDSEGSGNFSSLMGLFVVLGVGRIVLVFCVLLGFRSVCRRTPSILCRVPLLRLFVPSLFR